MKDLQLIINIKLMEKANEIHDLYLFEIEL
jgi:hypothetical protein